MRVIAILSLLISLRTEAVEFESLGQAIARALGTTKAIKSTVVVEGKSKDVFSSKDGSGQLLKAATVETGVYEPNCTHTWVIGLHAKTARVEQIRVVEMSCPHAFPTRKSTFLSQYYGKGPADIVSLEGSVQTIAKATGSSNLTTDAVKRSIEAVVKLGQSKPGKK